jgi:hypothetical protein
MAYRPRPFGLIRDKAYPSEIAAQRPLLAPRIHCEESQYEAENESIRGDNGEMNYDSGRREFVDDRVRDFNRALRGGHAYRNEGDDNED